MHYNELFNRKICIHFTSAATAQKVYDFFVSQKIDVGNWFFLDKTPLQKGYVIYLHQYGQYRLMSTMTVGMANADCWNLLQDTVFLDNLYGTPIGVAVPALHRFIKVIIIPVGLCLALPLWIILGIFDTKRLARALIKTGNNLLSNYELPGHEKSN